MNPAARALKAAPLTGLHPSPARAVRPQAASQRAGPAHQTGPRPEAAQLPPSSSSASQSSNVVPLTRPGVSGRVEAAQQQGAAAAAPPPRVLQVGAGPLRTVHSINAA